MSYDQRSIVTRHAIKDGPCDREYRAIGFVTNTAEYAPKVELRTSPKGKPRMVQAWHDPRDRADLPKRCKHAFTVLAGSGVHTCEKCGRVQDHRVVPETAYAPVFDVHVKDHRSVRARKRDKRLRKEAEERYASHKAAPMYPVISFAPGEHVDAYNLARWGHVPGEQETRKHQEMLNGYENPSRMEPFCHTRPTDTRGWSKGPIKASERRMPRHAWGEALGR